MAKPLALAGAIVALTAVFAGLCVISSAVSAAIVADASVELRPFAVAGPPIAQAVAACAIAALAGIAFAGVGLLVGTLTRDRTFTLTGFGLAYFLIPILGAGDPRNMIPVAGAEAFFFAGQFRPQALGGLPSGIGVLVLVLVFLIAGAGAAVVWRLRSRVPRS